MALNIELEIDELILHGVARTHGADVGEAIRGELARLLGQRGIPRSLARGATAPEIHGGSIHIRHSASPRSVGQQLAAAVYGSLGTL
jgi:hypothetical protein